MSIHQNRMRHADNIRPDVIVISCVRVLIFACLAFCDLADAQQQGAKNKQSSHVREKEISFTSSAARGGVFSLPKHPGHVVLLSFLQFLPDTEPTPSRTQLEVLRSMATQYGRNGISVVLVDESALKTGRPAPASDLLNATYDWDLKKIPLARDDEHKVAALYGVKEVPTTFLISRGGKLRRRWDGMVLTAELAKAIQNLIGGPMAGEVQGSR
jgi:peroxiredoxin